MTSKVFLLARNRVMGGRYMKKGYEKEDKKKEEGSHNRVSASRSGALYNEAAGSVDRGEAFHSVDRVAEKVAEYGRAADLKGMNPMKLGDILDIVIQEMSDLLLDGRAARRLVKACQTGGLPYDERLGERIDIAEKEAIYSSFQILGMRVELL